MMNYIDFVNKALLFSKISDNLEQHYDDFLITSLNKTNDIDKLFISTIWLSGGVCGNNCYDCYNIRIDSECEIDLSIQVIFLLEHLGFKITGFFLSSIMDLTENYTFKQDEDYYYNYLEYTRNFIYLKDIYNEIYILTQQPFNVMLLGFFY